MRHIRSAKLEALAQKEREIKREIYIRFKRDENGKLDKNGKLADPKKRLKVKYEKEGRPVWTLEVATTKSSEDYDPLGVRMWHTTTQERH
jgi:hypothetical protein